MRVMICQPDAGEDTAAWAMADRARVMALLESLGHQICEEIAGQDDAPAEGNTALWLLGKIFQVMASADAVYFMDGWTTDPKCRIAFAACMLLGRKAINANFHQLGDGYTSLLYYWIKNTPENIQRENLRCVAIWEGTYGGLLANPFSAQKVWNGLFMINTVCCAMNTRTRRKTLMFPMQNLVMWEC